MSKKAVLIFLMSLCLFAKDDQMWDYAYSFKLKKDQTARVLVSRSNKKKNSKEGVFVFRWTLFSNEGLVTLVNYQGHPTQHVLYRKKHQVTFIFKLIPDSMSLADRTYLMLIFSDFDKKKQRAVYDVYIKDPKKRIIVIFEDPNKPKLLKQK